ncbi:MAG: Holliday junction branch migration protein RuvA [Bryobacteraceae bacterium]|nr:Holliday junction branch migration protein RuvA [Bryobacteraceae bacterium]
MIALLRGILEEKHPNQAIVVCQGVGYDVAIPVTTFSTLPAMGEEVTLRVHTHVREDALVLYGFATVEEKALFEKLITVTGVGPKLAITILSGVPARELAGIIRTGEVAQLTRIPGIGKKTAERLVLELRDKIDFGAAPAASAGQPAARALSGLEQDCVSALVNLGGKAEAAETAVRKAAAETGSEDFEALFRRALQLMR